MMWRYRGRAGEYLWEKEKERLERYKDRPWELQSRSSAGDAFFALVFVSLGILGALLVFSLF